MSKDKETPDSGLEPAKHKVKLVRMYQVQPDGTKLFAEMDPSEVDELVKKHGFVVAGPDDK